MAVPSGIVTFLFTDIESSTALWDRHPGAMSEAQAMHDQVLRDEIAKRDGYIFSSAGDGVGASFGTPEAALETGIAVQVDLAQRAWPESIGALKVRMGLHTGPSVERRGDYFGSTVNRAARVMSVGNGGHIITTDTVRQLLADHRHDGWSFEDLGVHRLAGLTRAERLHHFFHPALGSGTDPLRHISRAGNVRESRTTLIGRDEATATVGQLVGEHRLVTLTGVGGVGKTSLAKSVAAQLAPGYADGVWFVDLAAVADGDDVVAATATALEIIQGAQDTILDRVIDALERAEMLIVLDNAEHVIASAAAFVDEILTRAPGTDVLVTSRERLRLSGERAYAVPPLDPASPVGGAVDLFIDRAAAAAPDLEFTAEDRDVIAEICMRLDGLPLAVELAAAKTETHAPQEILDELVSTLTLSNADRSADPRHRTLADTIQWSYGLLDPDARQLFDRLSVCLGGATLGMAEHLATGEVADVSATLQALVRASMMDVDRTGRSTRFRQLETLREFGRAQLDARGERGHLREQHATYIMRWAADIADRVRTSEEPAAMDEIMAEWPNVRAALQWATDTGAFSDIRNIGRVLMPMIQGAMSPEVAEWANKTMKALPPEHDERWPFAAAAAFAEVVKGRFDLARAIATAEKDLGPDHIEKELAFREIDAVTAWFRGDLEHVIAVTPALIEDGIEHGIPNVAARNGADFMLALDYEGRVAEVAKWMATLEDAVVASGQPTAMAWIKYARGDLTGDTEPEQAMIDLEDSVELAIGVHSEFLAGVSLTALAATAARFGDAETALDSMHRCIGFWERAGNRPLFWTTARNLVELLARLGHSEEAYLLHAASAADAEHAPKLFGPHGDRYLAAVDGLRADLSADQIARIESRTAGFDFADCVAAAFAAIEGARQATSETPIR